MAWSLAVGYCPRVLLSHALVAPHHGLGVSAITLHIFGCVSQLEDEPRSPGEECWMAIVGPLSSFAIVLVAGVAARTAQPAPVLAAILGDLAGASACVVITFNMGGVSFPRLPPGLWG